MQLLKEQLIYFIMQLSVFFRSKSHKRCMMIMTGTCTCKYNVLLLVL